LFTPQYQEPASLPDWIPLPSAPSIFLTCNRFSAIPRLHDLRDLGSCPNGGESSLKTRLSFELWFLAQFFPIFLMSFSLFLVLPQKTLPILPLFFPPSFPLLFPSMRCFFFFLLSCKNLFFSLLIFFASFLRLSALQSDYFFKKIERPIHFPDFYAGI